MPVDFYDKLKKNKEVFLSLTSEEKQFVVSTRSGADSETKLLKILKVIQRDLRQLTEEQEVFFKRVVQRMEEGALPKHTIKTTLKAIQEKFKTSSNQGALNLLAILQRNISDGLLKNHISENLANSSDKPREVILSEYLIKE